MKIESVRAWRQNLALQRPYTIARETITTVENVFLEVRLANGIRGMGAANPAPEVVGETPDQTLQHLQSDWTAGLIGTDIRQFQRVIYQCREQFPDCPGTLAALDIALHDAFGQFLDIPVVDFYGRHHQRMLTSVTIGIRSVAETLAEAREYYERGFRILKLKTGLDADLDAERIIKLREHFGHHFRIRVDANEGYSQEQLNAFLKQTESAAVELIEQPLPADRDADLRQLPAGIRAQLAADESLKNARSALKLAQEPRSYGIFNIKLMKCGGIRAALELATIARPADISLFWGCNDESIVSITAALHAAFACPHTRYLDLDGSLDLAEDVVSGGFILEDGFMYPAPGAGLGLKRLD
jgi:L-Ala-D/L-Glu epimerase